VKQNIVPLDFLCVFLEVNSKLRLDGGDSIVKKILMASMILAMFLLASLFLVGLTSSAGVYNPWYDLDDDGDIDIFDVVKMAGIYGTTGEPFEAKAAIEYDSGWIDITDKCGQCFDVIHNLNSTEVMVDVAGKTAVDGGAHQRNLGGTGFIPGWAQTYGRADPEYGHSVIQTTDGGYALAGTTRSFGAGDFDSWVIKTDAIGNHLWNQTHGGLGNDGACCIIQTYDGGYAIAGDTDSFGAGNRDFWLVKTDRFGDHVWNQTYGGTGQDYGTSVVQTSDGGFVIVGNTMSFGAGIYDILLIKTDASGNHQWNQTHGGANIDYGLSVVPTVDGGYAITGTTYSFGAGMSDIWLVKTDKQGNHVWDQTYGGVDIDHGSQVVQTVDGYVIVGYTMSFGAGDYDSWLIKTDRFGDHVWNQTYGGVDPDYGNSVVQTEDGGYAIAGSTYSFGAGLGDVWLVKTDASGSHQWNKTHGGIHPDYGRSIVQTGDEGFVIVGDTDSFGAGFFDFWLVRISMESGLAWTDSTTDSITLYRGATDSYWNDVRVRIWKIKDTP